MTPRALLLAPLLIASVLAVTVIGTPVHAQSQCPIGGSISLPPGYRVNIRTLPDGNAAYARDAANDTETFTVLATAKDSQGRTWWNIGPGMWAIGSYWIIVCPSGTPSPTPSPSPTRTLVPSATVMASQTPTPIVSNEYDYEICFNGGAVCYPLEDRTDFFIRRKP